MDDEQVGFACTRDDVEIVADQNQTITPTQTTGGHADGYACVSSLLRFWSTFLFFLFFFLSFFWSSLF